MSKQRVPFAMIIFTLGLLACSPTPAQVNNSGHEPYLDEDYDAALDAYERAQGQTEEVGEPYYNAGNALYRMEDYEGSLQQYDESLQYAEGVLRSSGFFNRGDAYYQTQQYDQAVEAYKEVLRMNPDDIQAKHNLELALAQIPPQEQGQEPEESQEPGPGQPQDDQEQGGDEQQDEQGQEDQQESDQQQDQQPDQEQNEQQDQQPRPQTEPVTEEQARQILQTVGADAQTLQERLQQILVAPNPPSEYDW